MGCFLCLVFLVAVVQAAVVQAAVTPAILNSGLSVGFTATTAATTLWLLPFITMVSAYTPTSIFATTGGISATTALATQYTFTTTTQCSFQLVVHHEFIAPVAVSWLVTQWTLGGVSIDYTYSGVAALSYSKTYDFVGSCVSGDTIQFGVTYNTGTTATIVAGMTLLFDSQTNINYVNVAQLAATAVSTTTAGILDINTKNIGNSAVTSALGIQTVLNVGLPSITIPPSATLSTAVANGVTTALASAFAGGVLNSFAGTDSPIYPDGDVVSAFPNLYHSPVFGNAMPRSAFFHACVNGTGNFRTDSLFTAPNGTCGFEATVSVSSVSSSSSGVVTAGIALNTLAFALASVVGSGNNINTNTYLDTCGSQGNYVFLNSTSPGTSCVDVTLTLNEGPNDFPDPVLGIDVAPGLMVCGDFSSPNWQQCHGNVATGTPTATSGHFNRTVNGNINLQYSCTKISVDGIFISFTFNSATIVLNPTVSNPTGYLIDFPGQILVGQALVVTMGAVTGNVVCGFVFSITAFGASTPDSGTAMYATSYVNGPPQQWYYPLTTSLVEDAEIFERQKRMSKYIK